MTTTPATDSRRLYFWGCACPFIETSLICGVEARTGESQCKIEIHDSEGQLINEVELGTNSERLSVLELDPLLAACRIESGLKHCQLTVHAPQGIEVCTRLQSHNSCAFASALRYFSIDEPALIPVQIAADRKTLIVITNPVAEAAHVRCRLYAGQRSPELTLVVPPFGARAVSINVEFPEIFEAVGARSVAAYVRVTTRAGRSSAFCGCIEQTLDSNGMVSALGVM